MGAGRAESIGATDHKKRRDRVETSTSMI